MDAPSSDDTPTPAPGDPLSPPVPPSGFEPQSAPVSPSSFAPQASTVPPSWAARGSAFAPPWPEVSPAPLPPVAFEPPPSGSAIPPGAPGGWISGPGRASSWRAARTETRRRTFWLIMLTIVLVPVVVVLIALALAGREVGVIASISDDTDGLITRASINTVGGRVQWELFAAPGLGEADGTRLACDVVRPVFSRHGIRDAEFYVLDRAGDVIGSWRTFCGAPEPDVPAA